MKCQIPEISWHNRDPVLSVDIQPKGANDRDHQYRLASGGTDSHVLIWYMIQNPMCGTINLELAADLTRHQRAVNAVRWSPSGELLASGDDESVIFIWKQKGETETLNILDTTNEQDKETWLTMKILRGHMEDVYDLSWSANSQFLISGSVDNTAIVWDVQRGKNQAILQEHKGFVQGVAWDPQNKYLATLSTDRSFRVYDAQTKRVVSRCNKCVLPVPQAHPLRDKTVRLFHDDTLQTFFRRLCFSPDGNLIVTPSGVAEIEGVPKPLNTTYIFSRNSLRQPCLTLPSPDQYSVAVRFCPVYFQHRSHAESKPPLIPLPYRMVFAVATKSSVYLYDTQQAAPFALISNIHYTRLTDMSWSSDGKILIVSSTDGFCSLIFFAEGELGTVYEAPASETSLADNPSTPPPLSETNKRSPSPSAKQKSASGGIDDTKRDKKSPQLIAIRRKPKPEENSSNRSDDVEGQSAVEKSVKPVELQAVEFVIEKDKIISSAEKFDSPAKKDRPVTPIAVRRHPRTPSDKSSDPQQTQAASSVGKNSPKPIAIRRHPRALETGVAKSVIEPTAEEDANDTWPIDEPKPVAVIETKKKHTMPQPCPMETDQTEDIVLIVESDGEDDVLPVVVSADEPPKESNTETQKTPRRVEFRTISTPKSKKKLL
ncbi:chromatin assembly factor 1 subunit B [Anopheles marshallii]|uniref:chromatin assembly factor 1 subunit B n=1 Tax=Anopheles marshallii TaxID=1521116 RepID=UPI00237BC50F|nr:chromatin assembly factor 1 subunit B [Anopheles marshallii]